MRPRLGRLRARPEFLQVAAAGCKWSTPGLVLQAGRATRRKAAAPQGPDGTSSCEATIRVGFTASRKVGPAVARNRAKRRLRALAAELLPDSGTPGTDYVLIGRPATVHRPFALLRADFAQALEGVARRAARPVDARRQPAPRQGRRGRADRNAKSGEEQRK